MSAVINYSPLYIVQQAKLQCPGVPDNIALDALNRVMRKFYLMSTSWRQIVGPITIAQGTDTYPLNPVDNNTQLQFVYEAWLYPVLGSNARQDLVARSRKAIGAQSYLPSTYFMTLPDVMVLYPVPDKAYGAVLYAYGAMVPTPNVQQLPTFTMTHHLDSLTEGLLARLMGMPNKPWTDKATAAEHSQNFSRDITMWRAWAERNYGPAAKPALFPTFAGRHPNALPAGV